MKGKWFTRFLMNRDHFGHSMKLEYKERETYNSLFGGIMTLLMQGLTLVMVIQAIIELYSMEDPIIINYTKPADPEDISRLIPLKFSEHDNYVIAFRLSELIPPEFGAVWADVHD